MASSKTSKTPAPSTVAVKVDTAPEAPAEKKDPVATLVAAAIVLPTVELKKLYASMRLELKVREEEVAARRPSLGALVNIVGEKAGKRWNGRSGTVLLANKSRVFVKVDGFLQAANVPLDCVFLADNEEG